MKKVLLLFLLTISMALSNQSMALFNNDAVPLVEEKENPIVLAFEESGALFYEASINNTLHLENKFFEIDEMEGIISSLIGKLSLKGDIQWIDNVEYYDPYYLDETFDMDKDIILIRKNTEIGYNQIIVTAIDEKGKITTVIVYSFNSNDIKESYIIIDIVKNKGYKDIEELNQQSIEILEAYGKRVEGTISMVGFYQEKKNINEISGIINDISLLLRARIIEELIDDPYTSTTLYSPYLSNSIKYQNKKVNLQLATRYNSYEDRTYIWIASPLVMSTY